jgi:hypothetical protein
MLGFTKVGLDFRIKDFSLVFDAREKIEALGRVIRNAGQKIMENKIAVIKSTSFAMTVGGSYVAIFNGFKYAQSATTIQQFMHGFIQEISDPIAIAGMAAMAGGIAISFKAVKRN